MHLLHLLIVAGYVVGPPAAVVHAVLARGRRRGGAALRRLRLAVVGGVGFGVMPAAAAALAGAGRPVSSQVLLACYFAAGLVLLLQWADAGLVAGVRAAFRLDRPGRSRGRFVARAAGASLVRTAVVFGVGIPYVLAAVLTYRTHSRSDETPESKLGWAYDDVTFPASVDATPIAAWWIPATGGAADRTVLLCPGAVGTVAAHLPLVRQLRPDGWNVLAIEFRGRGRSGGQLCSFGDLERRDVLGAVRWLRATRPAACRRIAGLGVNTGAAALLAAAADPSDDGQRIATVAVYGCYDTLADELAAVARPVVPGPVIAALRRVGLPLASAQVGADLAHFSPADRAAQLWPRPLLVIHAADDPFVPMEQGVNVYDAAGDPKDAFWVGGHDEYEKGLANPAVARAVRRHFDTARAVI